MIAATSSPTVLLAYRSTVGCFLFTEYYRNCRSYSKLTFDGKLRTAHSTDMLNDSKTEAGAADALGVGFIHTIEALA